jgi:hypothetical protein
VTYDLAFTKREWWAAVAGAVLLAVLMFAFGFVSGALWQRRPPAGAPQAPTAETATKPAPGQP